MDNKQDQARVSSYNLTKEISAEQLSEISGGGVREVSSFSYAGGNIDTASSRRHWLWWLIPIFSW